MIRLLIRWTVNALALFVVAEFVEGIAWSSFPALFIAALVLGLLNAVVRPILFWLTLPITILTLGLFLIVLNAAMLALAAFLVPGFSVAGIVPAVIGSILLAIISFLTNWIGRKKKD